MEDMNIRDAMETETIHYYKWRDRPVIYDDKYATAFQYMDGKWSVIDRHSFDDYAEEIVDDNELQQFFPEDVKIKYREYIIDRYKFIPTAGKNIADVFRNDSM